MYQFVKASCLSRSIGSQWVDRDLSAVSVYDIFAQYSKVYLTLHNTFTDADQYVDLDSLKAEFSVYSGDLSALLITLSGRTLETVESIPSTTIKYLKYSDAFQAQYKIEIGKNGYVLPENYPDSAKPDLLLTRPKYPTDLSLIHTHCLVSVNGFIHNTSTGSENAAIIDGAITVRKSGNNQIGLISFNDIGKLTKISLTSLQITAAEPDGLLKDKIRLDIDQELDGKCYIMVLGGYLVFPQPDVFWRNGEKSFLIDMHRIPYLQRLFESNNYLDISSLNLTPQSIGDDVYDVNEIFSDDVLRKYFTMSQSFLVLVDTDTLSVNRLDLRRSPFPGNFTTYQEPIYPMITGYGRIAEYWKTHEGDHWSLSVQDNYLRNYVAEQQPYQSYKLINDHMLSFKPYMFSRGYLLEVAGYKNY